MSAPPMRPVFAVEVALPPDELMSRIRQRLSDPSSRCRGGTVDNHAELFVSEDEAHFWSPWLSISVEASESGGSLVRGRFGPRPHVWTGFMFAYFSLGTATVFGAIWGLSQWSLGMAPDLLWSVPAGLLACALVYVASLVGQRMGADQMRELRETLFVSFGHVALPGDDPLSDAAAESQRP